jgi:hypothetical protein
MAPAALPSSRAARKGHLRPPHAADERQICEPARECCPWTDLPPSGARTWLRLGQSDRAYLSPRSRIYSQLLGRSAQQGSLG